MKFLIHHSSSLAKITLAFTLLVILWGAFVRATGSGAGCGQHWPLCNGEVIPQDIRIKTFVEFFHRVTSGIDLILVLLSSWITWRASISGSVARKAAIASVVFILTEAAVGAGLVLLQLVENNQSILRAIALAVHLTNTFLLVAALSLQVFWQKSNSKKIPWPSLGGWLALSLTILIGITGAVTALGDTIFPKDTAIPNDHFLLKLRIIHPIVAVIAGIFLIGFARSRLMLTKTEVRPAIALIVTVTLQWLLGLTNVALMAPTWIQLLHLLLADLLWILVVRLAFFR